MQTYTNLIVESSTHNKPILTDVVFQKNEQKKPVVIFCHGYKGYKDWGAWNLAAETFARNNVFFVKFNFSHNGGTINDPIDFPDLKAFGKNTFTLELDDLEDVINWTTEHDDFKNEMDINNITLIGHSRGGGIVTIKSSENKRISKLITWAGVSDFGARFPKGEMLKEWERQGVSYVLNSRTNQKMPHLFQFYKNFKENEERLTIKNAIASLKIPHMIIHGEKDDVVLQSEAENMHFWNPKSKLLIIEGMNHPLGCTQPWIHSEMPSHLGVVVDQSLQFVLNGSL